MRETCKLHSIVLASCFIFGPAAVGVNTFTSHVYFQPLFYSVLIRKNSHIFIRRPRLQYGFSKALSWTNCEILFFSTEGGKATTKNLKTDGTLHFMASCLVTRQTLIGNSWRLFCVSNRRWEIS